MMLDPDTVCDLIYKLRRLHGSEISEPDGADGSNDADDGMDDVLVAGRDRGNLAEITGLLEGLESEQREELGGMILIGREPDAYQNLNAAKAAAREADLTLLDLLRDDAASPEYLAAALEGEGIRCEGPGTSPALSPAGDRERRRE